jgi:hypothetical protein
MMSSLAKGVTAYVETGQADWVLTLRADRGVGRLNQGRSARPVRGLRILDVEPIVPVEPKAALVLDRLAPVLGGASDAAAVDDAFGVGFDVDTHRVEAALSPAAFLDCMPSGRTRRVAPSLFAYLSMNSIVCSSAAGETLKRPV